MFSSRFVMRQFEGLTPSLVSAMMWQKTVTAYDMMLGLFGVTMREPETANDWLDAIHREFRAETDRGAAIFATAMLDEALRNLIQRSLVPALRERHPEFGYIDLSMLPPELQRYWDELNE